MVKRLNISSFLDEPNSVILDVRTPSEYANGHISGAINVPLFSDQERVEIGTLYVRVSKEAAVERGLELVGPKLATFVRQARHLSHGKQILLYCWRGGMRSGSMQWLLDTAGFQTAQLIGGYKAYRKAFDTLLKQPWHFQIIAGPTGCGKTEILRHIESAGYQTLDLEGLAHHKGSAFGALGQLEQPTTETFINAIHEKLRKLDPRQPVFVEGESMLIGHVFIPPQMFEILSNSPIIHFELSHELRVQRIIEEYGHFDTESLIQAFDRIKKRLGYDNYKMAVEALQASDVKTAVEIAMVYYDKSYAKSIGKRPVTPLYFTSESDNQKENALKIIELCKQ